MEAVKTASTASQSPAAELQVEDISPSVDDLADGVDEKRVKWKLDLSILPLLSSIYFLAQMGRSDLGNAKNAGMEVDLNMTAGMYSNVASIFLVGYLLGQLPGTLLLRKIGPPYQFAGAMVSWGVVTTATAWAKNYSTLMGLRVLVGLAEAFIQGAVFYLSFWYKNTELATRGSFLYSTNALAGAFNGLLAYAVQQNMDDRNGWSAWRWIFLIEGVLPVGWALAIALFLPSTPQTVRLGFSPAEKAMLVKRSMEANNTGNSKVQPKLILRVLADPQFWMLALIQGGINLSHASTSSFLPAILEGLGYEGVQSQLMTVIVYAVSFVFILVFARLSDLSKKRGIFILISCLIIAVGYIILLTSESLQGRFVATCLVSAGANAPVVIILAWAASANVGYTYRGSVVALINVVSQFLAIAGNQAFKDPPLYHKGMTISLVVILVVAVIVCLLMLYFWYMNKKKLKEQDSAEADRLRAFSIDEIGNRHPDFFFSF
ncbi:putative pantothenate transporter [Thozetella sp. PMI_491]|nr:putative pantothenate transporter [Thozetella sp. PMI_491]